MEESEFAAQTRQPGQLLMLRGPANARASAASLWVAPARAQKEGSTRGYFACAGGVSPDLLRAHEPERRDDLAGVREQASRFLTPTPLLMPR
jgi:hypothetical protein